MSEDIEQVRQQLIQAMRDLDENLVLSLVQQRVDLKDDPISIIEDCQEGLRQVGICYEQRKYYLSGLILASDILREVMEIVQAEVEKHRCSNSSGVVLLGTVKSDIHDLGKGIFAMLLSCYGYTVHDLGVNVSPEQFVETYRQTRPDMIGFSGLLTSSHQSMRDTAQQIRAIVEPAAPAPYIVIGGLVNDEVGTYVGADYWTVDAMAGIRWCQSHIQQKVQVP